MADTVLIHPAARMPAAYDATGQGWLPPLWLWPESPWHGSWEWRHEPEYLVATGRAASIGKAHLMLVELLWASQCLAAAGHAAASIGAAHLILTGVHLASQGVEGPDG